MKIISKIAKIILTIVVILMIILSLNFVWLKNGISINSYKNDIFSIEQLYIKFDNKLILKAKNINIYGKNSLESTKFDAKIFENLAKYFRAINSFFQEIDLKNIKIYDTNLTVLYKDKIFYIDTPFLKIDTEIFTKDKKFKIGIKELSFKDFNLTLIGDLYIDFIDKFYYFDGFFSTHEINGKLDFNIENKILKYNIKSVYASSLEQFMNELGFKTAMDEDLKEWIYGKIVAKNYYIDFLDGEIDLSKLDYKLYGMKGEGYAYDLNVSFDKNLSPVKVESAKITLLNGNLKFELQNPKYIDKNLYNSSVFIKDLFKNTKILIYLKTDSLLDDEILKILKNYDIDLPFKQLSGELKSEILLDIGVDPFDVKYNGNFELKNSQINLNNIKFDIKNSQIDLNNSLIDIKNTSLKFGDIFDIKNITGSINLNKKIANLNADFKNLSVENIYNKINFQTPIDIDFSGKITNVVIYNLGVNLKLSPGSYLLYLQDLNSLALDSEFLQDLNVERGKVEIATKNFKNFKIKVQDFVAQTPFLTKDGKSYKQDDLNIEIKNSIIRGFTKSDLINFNILGDEVNLDIKNLDLILVSDKNQTSTPNIKVNAINSNIIFKDINKTLYLDSYSANLYENSTKFKGKTLNNGEILLTIKPNLLSFFAQKISGENINEFLNRKIFEKGEFMVKAIGSSFDDFRGEILIKKGYLSDLVLYQKLLSFINSIPSLLNFKTPDFNNKGFSVKDGKIYFTKKQNILNINALNLNGSSADIAGKGNIDLKSGALNLDLELIYLKDASSIIGYIPIFNQVILGKDRAISTIIEIRGYLNNPIFKNRVVSDVLLSPFNLIKNTIELPFVIFD
ncbi:DUF3971 domain-containing protein [Campylobacter sp. FMV-PI01]|uniref:DUF3971 domain-containing protein n=1 Tax=Campylobacter portucalensis TaxID=2608384 RepID=A0A6L5WJ54_9BACT|nr:AsmA-like C-terminal domain-containing protein [Campylobacter portucalensis]MSN96287.1 DUF3971 domain-containing protein [Campylobacter portucalensis]